MRKQIIGIIALASLIVLGSAVPTFAQGKPEKGPLDRKGENRLERSAEQIPLIGTVTAKSGTMLTVSGKSFSDKNAASSTFTVDASNAKIFKNMSTSTVAEIATGDRVSIQGTLSGTTLTAKTIRIGISGPGMGYAMGKDRQEFVGNGQPVIAGKITAISSTSMSISNNSNTTYNVDITNAKIMQKNTSVSSTSLKIGDVVVVQGNINGTSITASSVIDQTKPIENNKPTGFFGGVGNFFKHLFGF